jgi:hypothetical protein
MNGRFYSFANEKSGEILVRTATKIWKVNRRDKKQEYKDRGKPSLLDALFCQRRSK